MRDLRRTKCGAARRALALSLLTCAAFAIALMTPRVSVRAAERCSEAQKATIISKVDDHKKGLTQAQGNLEKQRIVTANQFLSSGTISVANDEKLFQLQRDVTQWQVIVDHDRAEFVKCFGYEPPSLLGEGVSPKKSAPRDSTPATRAAGAPNAAAFVGSYKATVTGPNPPNTNTYWGHVVGYNPDGTVQLALYAYQDNYHVTLKGGTLTMESGNGSKANGTGSIAGNGAIGTTITMRWTLTGSDGKPTPYTWVLTKYDNRDFGQTQSGFAR